MNHEQILLLIKHMIDLYFTNVNAIGQQVYNFYYMYSRAILDFIHVLFQGTFNVLLFITIVLALFYTIMSIAISFRKNSKLKKLKRGNEPLVTIQIPTYNELAALNCAKKCINFDYPKEKMQIIIGDDSNDKSVSDKIDQFAAQYPGLITVTRRGKNIGFKPGNLNHMLKFTKGKYIVIFDSDFLPDKDFLRKIIAPLEEDSGLSVVQARWKIDNFNQNVYSILGGTISLISHRIALTFINMFKGNLFLCGSAEVIRKKDLLEIGGWRVGSLTEDIECSFRLHTHGKKLAYLENLECRCEAPQTFMDLCKQQMRWAYGVISALKLHLKDIFLGKNITLKSTISILILVSGYIFSFLLLGLTVFGVLSVISNRPAPIDWARFLSETFRNIALTSGFLISSVVALSLSKKARQIPKMLASSLSVGLAVTYYVNVGIFKAIFNRGMQWFMLKKLGNKVDP